MAAIVSEVLLPAGLRQQLEDHSMDVELVSPLLCRQDSGSPLSHLPPDLLTHALSFLPGSTLYAVSAVCREWRAVVDSNQQLFAERVRVEFGRSPEPGMLPKVAYREAVVHARVEQLTRLHERCEQLRLQEAELQDVLSRTLTVRQELMETDDADTSSSTAALMNSIWHMEQDAQARLAALYVEMQGNDQAMIDMQGQLVRMLCK